LSDIILRLERLHAEARNREVRVVVTKDLGKIIVDGKTFTLTKGIEAELPLWLAEALAEKGVINLAENTITIDELARVHFSVMNARSPADLEPLPSNFYYEAARYLSQLRDRIRKELDPKLLEERHKAQEYLAEIIDRRLSLILRSIKSPATIAEISSKLSKEEHFLLTTLNNIIDKWKNKLTSLAGNETDTP